MCRTGRLSHVSTGDGETRFWDTLESVVDCCSFVLSLNRFDCFKSADCLKSHAFLLLSIDKDSLHKKIFLGRYSDCHCIEDSIKDQPQCSKVLATV